MYRLSMFQLTTTVWWYTCSMKKQITWWGFISVAIVCYLLKAVLGGVIGDVLYALGGLMLIMGIIMGIAQLLRRAVHGKEKA